MAEIVDSLATFLPVDTSNVFVVGHSMGAGAAVGAASKTPERLRAVAALGGGGAPSESCSVLPFFVAAGASDFGLGMSKGLAGRLRELGCEHVDEKVYPATEHLLVVQRALPDVFAFFDAELAH
ncbi:MAG: hypothetical protein R3F34_11065 [Planctomycetota bacterium]